MWKVHVTIRHDPYASKNVAGCILSSTEGPKMEILDHYVQE